MQSSSLRTCPSKPLGLYAGFEWGLRDVKFLSPFSFSGNKDGTTFKFHVAVSDYDKEFNVAIPTFTEPFIILFIPNKTGDNCVLLSMDRCSSELGKKVSMQWIADNLSRKWAMKISPTSTA
jgi:hypothetical protein